MARRFGDSRVSTAPLRRALAHAGRRLSAQLIWQAAPLVRVMSAHSHLATPLASTFCLSMTSGRVTPESNPGDWDRPDLLKPVPRRFA